MRFSGKLHSWNEERGFGFIRPDGGGQDIFVHASVLPAPRPQLGEVLTFEVALNAESKKKAVQVRRQRAEQAGAAADQARDAQRMRPSRSRNDRIQRRRNGSAVPMVALVIVGAIGWYGWHYVQGKSAPPRFAEQPDAQSVLVAPSFRCDGRTHCSQMTSCQEAEFFLAQCPGVQMDGNNDGVPCQAQWCGR